MPHPRARVRAFTLVELLVVVGIIAVLVTITIGVAASVADSGRKRATEGVLRALDQTLDVYIENRGEIPPAWVEMRIENAGPQRFDTRLFPIMDGVAKKEGGSELEPVATTAFYLHEARQLPSVQSIIAGIDSKFVRSVRFGESVSSGDQIGSSVQAELTLMLDAWGNPVRMVHPRFDGTIRGDSEFATVNVVQAERDGYITLPEAGVVSGNQLGAKLYLRQIRRLAPSREEWRTLTADEIAENFVGGVGDADGGICPSPRPYFYSAGPDGDPATIDDNVYTVRPRFGEAG